MFSSVESPNTKPLPKSILLVLLHNTSNAKVDCDLFHSIFSSFGAVQKILIFEKNVPIKAFVELAEEKQALAARDSLNNTFQDQNKINVYLSELSELKLPIKNIKFARDYTQPLSESSSPPLKEVDSRYSKMSPQIFTTLQAASLYTIQEMVEYKGGVENEKESYQDSQNFQDRPPPGLEKSFKAFKMQKGIFLEKLPHQQEPDLSTESDKTFKAQKSAIYESMKTPSTNESIIRSPPLFEVLSAGLVKKTAANLAVGASNSSLLWEENSKVLYVKGITSKEINVKHIYNLFSNFGDIKRIILLRAKEVALIEFENLEYAKIARENLNNLCFFEEYLKISYSNYKEIIPKNISKNTNKEDLLICETSHSRFKTEKNLNINPPSQILHLSNLDKNSCTEEKIQEFFSDVCEVDKMKFIFADEFKNMCLVKCKRLEDALKAISIKHNSKLDARKIKISFTKSKV